LSRLQSFCFLSSPRSSPIRRPEKTAGLRVTVTCLDGKPLENAKLVVIESGKAHLTDGKTEFMETPFTRRFNGIFLCR